MNKIFHLYILFGFFFTAGVFAFADEPGSDSETQIPSVSSDAGAGPQASYLYDLKKLIAKSREYIKEVNQKIKEQAVLKRNQMREERAREYYEKGVELTNEGKLDEARDYFEKAIRITQHPEMAGYIRTSQQRLKKQESALQAQEREHYNQIKQGQKVRKEDVEEAYKEAVALYKQKKYHPAKDAFEHVDEISPDYRATSSYLKLIDQDIFKADALAVKQQAVEIARQQKEAQAARVKEKQMWLAQIEEKEKERKEATNRQAADVYDQAVELYKNKKFAQAKKKFEEVSWVIPNYKATIKYLRRIDRDAQIEQERVASQQQKALQQARWEEMVEQKKQEAQRQSELKARELQKKKDLQEQAQFLYQGAVNLFNKKNWEGSQVQFESVEKLLPNFKNTRRYLLKLEGLIPRAVAAKNLIPAAVIPSQPAPKSVIKAPLAVVKIPVAPPSVIASPPLSVIARSEATKSAPMNHRGEISPIQRIGGQSINTIEDQQQQAQEVTALAQESAQLYRQIADIADDKWTAQTKRKMAQVDEILNSLKENKERLLRQMREAQYKRQQEESKAKQEERMAEAKKIYQEGLKFFRSHEYRNAEIEFFELENIVPDYKSTRRYLSRIGEYQRRAKAQAVIIREQKENAAKQASLKELAQKASDINDDIIRLSKEQDYEGMKAKFTELENTVSALRALKEGQHQKKLAKVMGRVPKPAVVAPPVMSTKQLQQQTPPAKIKAEAQEKERIQQAQLEARREAVRKQLENGVEAMYQEALSSFKRGDYTAAADRFKDIQDIIPGYKRTEQYMDEARRRSLNPQPVFTTPITVSSSSPVSRQESVSKTLDLFDSNVQ